MRGVENRIAFNASPRIVFKHLANPQNIPLFVPGILDASVVERNPDGVGTRIALTTRHRRSRTAVVTGEAERRFLCIQDDHGTVNEWELKRAPDGSTLATNRILGEFSDREASRLHHDARVKLFAFKDYVESRHGHVHKKNA